METGAFEEEGCRVDSTRMSLLSFGLSLLSFL